MTYNLSVVFPTLNGKEDTKECLTSLNKVSFPKKNDLEVVVVDNGSTDGVAEMINKDFPSVKFHQLKKNIGFAAAINIGIKRSKGSWIFVTNSDVIFDRNIFKELLSFIDRNNSVEIAGPIVYSYADRNYPSGFDMPGYKSNLIYGKISSMSTKMLKNLSSPKEVDWVSGSGILVKKELFEKIGYFDESLFAYWEDSDFGLRANKKGFKTYLVPSAKLWHKGSKTLGAENPQKIYYLIRNGRIVIYRHSKFIGKLTQVLRDMIFLAGTGARIVLDTKNRSAHRAKILALSDFYLKRMGERKI